MMGGGEDPLHQVAFDEFGLIADGGQGEPGIPLQQQVAVGGQAIGYGRCDGSQGPSAPMPPAPAPA